MISISGDRVKILLSQLAVLMVGVGAWEILGSVSEKWAFLVGSPSKVVLEVMLLLQNGLVWHLLITGFEAVAGLLIGTVVGCSLGLAFWFSDRAMRIARPFVLAVGTLPVLAFAPLMIVWFGIGVSMKVAMATFATLFIAFEQAHRGARSVSEDLMGLMLGMGASKAQVFWKVVVPGSLDWVLNSMRLNIGFSLLGAFIGEFIASDRGLGFLILRAASLYNVPRAIAAALGITILALLFDRVASWIESRRHVIVQWVSVPRILWRR